MYDQANPEETRQRAEREMRLKLTLTLARRGKVSIAGTEYTAAQYVMEEHTLHAAVSHAWEWALSEAANKSASDDAVGRAFRAWLDMNVADLARELHELDTGENRRDSQPVRFY